MDCDMMYSLRSVRQS